MRDYVVSYVFGSLDDDDLDDDDGKKNLLWQVFCLIFYRAEIFGTLFLFKLR